MKFLRLLFFPFSLLYYIVTRFRNFLYDNQILKSYSFDIPIIAVGNLSVGGTGKTPQIEFLIRLLSENYKIAVLSRGYKRKSEGFVLADATSTAEILGDEPFQMHQKFPKIKVAVDANRKNGIEKLLQLPQKPEVILLDDAFQHRKVKAGFYILLTTYSDLFCDDFLLPTGNLRESRNGAKRADCIIITKCPITISEEEKQKIIKKINLDKPIFFSSIEYDDFIYSTSEKIEVEKIKLQSKILLAGIAKPKPFFDYLENSTDEKLIFADHHHFSDSEIQSIREKSSQKTMVTTEKDYVRLQPFGIKNLFYLPIKSRILEEENMFKSQILEYVGKSTKSS